MRKLFCGIGLCTVSLPWNKHTSRVPFYPESKGTLYTSTASSISMSCTRNTEPPQSRLNQIFRNPPKTQTFQFNLALGLQFSQVPRLFYRFCIIVLSVLIRCEQYHGSIYFDIRIVDPFVVHPICNASAFTGKRLFQIADHLTALRPSERVHRLIHPIDINAHPYLSI